MGPQKMVMKKVAVKKKHDNQIKNNSSHFYSQPLHTTPTITKYILKIFLNDQTVIKLKYPAIC